MIVGICIKEGRGARKEGLRRKYELKTKKERRSQEAKDLRQKQPERTESAKDRLLEQCEQVGGPGGQRGLRGP